MNEPLRITNIQFDTGRELVVQTHWNRFVQKFVTVVIENCRTTHTATNPNNMHDYVVKYMTEFVS